MTLPAHAVCYRALATRDARFDGRLFVGVTSTGVYCRPICPARTPRPENCRFFPSAAAAQAAGFRPCLRCWPELSPDAAAWRGTSNTVSRALALIAEGALDGGEAGVPSVAARLGMGERQLRRLFERHLGVSPIAVAQTRRVLFAKQLIQETALPMIDVAEAAGFGSVRRFNDAFRRLYGRPPRELRAKRRVGPSALTLRLGYRPPYDWDAMLSFLAARAIEGVELIEHGRYWRTMAIDDACGSVMVGPGRVGRAGRRRQAGYAGHSKEAGHAGHAGHPKKARHPGGSCLVATIRMPHVRGLLAIVARLRRLFDLDADVEAIGAHLRSDASLAPLLARRPGLRAPGAWDGFELAVRAVLGQQISVAAARRLAGRLVARAGTPVPADLTGHERLSQLFPTATQVAGADLSGLGLPRSRVVTLQSLARAAVAEPRFVAPAVADLEVLDRLGALPGVGPWTAQYWALRALRDSDAFPAADVGLRRSPAVANATPLSPKALLARAEAWRPWRAYAAQHLWTAAGDRRTSRG